MPCSGLLSNNRVNVGLPPPLRDWLIRESRRLSVSVPELIRATLLAAWKKEEAGNWTDGPPIPFPNTPPEAAGR